MRGFDNLSWYCQLVHDLVGPINLRSHQNAMLSFLTAAVRYLLTAHEPVRKKPEAI